MNILKSKVIEQLEYKCKTDEANNTETLNETLGKTDL